LYLGFIYAEDAAILFAGLLLRVKKERRRLPKLGLGEAFAAAEEAAAVGLFALRVVFAGTPA